MFCELDTKHSGCHCAIVVWRRLQDNEELGSGQTGLAVGNVELRNAESKMRNRKCGMTLIGQSAKPRDRRRSADYRSDSTTDRVVKCRPAMRKMQATMQ